MTTTARELYDKMLEIYPDRANPSSLWGGARGQTVISPMKENASLEMQKVKRDSNGKNI
jgi:hypothetical protein